MPGKDDGILKRLLAMFQVEAQEHLQTIASGLVDLERSPNPALLETIFRAAHSLKGAARAVNVTDVEGVCQALESVFAAMKRGEIIPTAQLFDALHASVDALGKLLHSPEGTPRPHVTDVVHAMQEALKPGAPAAGSRAVIPAVIPAVREAPARPAAPAEEIAASIPAQSVRAGGETVRVAAERLDAVLLQAEELLSAKLAASQRATRLRQLQGRSMEWKKKWSRLRPDLRGARQTLETRREGEAAAFSRWTRLVQFLEWNQAFVESLDNELVAQTATADHDQRTVGLMVDNLLDEMKKVVMQPCSMLLDVFPRFIRELSREQGKEIDFQINGGEIEIDRRILDEMKDPLIHLVRNCLDHGIEAPARRAAQGKPARGTISIGISGRDGSSVELVIADDGGGIDAEKVRTAAVKQGLLNRPEADALGDREAVPMIFEAGVSTSPIVTDISGRGLGLAIVKEKVEKLSGTLAVETAPHRGTTFRIVLPMTLARFRGIIVRVAGRLYVLPTVSVERVTRVKREEVLTVENRETIEIAGRALALVRLSSILSLPEPETPPDYLLTVVLGSGAQHIAFVVDEILDEQEVLVKSLGRQLARVRNIGGATVLGSGEVAPILNVPDLMKSAVRLGGTGALSARTAEITVEEKKSLLVAEDSITSRTLLKNILETAGYQVETAVDGVDAFTKVQTGHFDLVVSDVDMPRMNGFGLTTKIRGDKRFAELPVVLVTALESREDREHGIDAGASAYIVKSSFDQSNLLEVIRRFL
ncbi:MAG TPA: hybrid sensor histidine kinase/response regulator [Chthoniobacteraceae bacterium]|jgi:two-component system chemotaxis sensor kinase CheA|nr:hybrid sensor histidine kinase/response regulator [Chthoniobacteraceae bacterium]